MSLNKNPQQKRRPIAEVAADIAAALSGVDPSRDWHPWKVTRAEEKCGAGLAELELEGATRSFLIERYYSTGDRADRLAISGTWPRDKQGALHYPRGGSPKITIGANYSANYIAKHIEKRFLPEWGKLYDAMLAEVQEANAYHEEKNFRVAELARILGESVMYRAGEESIVRIYWRGAGLLYGDFQCNSGTNIKLTIDNFELVKQIALVLARWKSSIEKGASQYEALAAATNTKLGEPLPGGGENA